ncbi:MAG: histidinol dehydrogenase [Myxococcales bacterium FL481]|nr:MAG: histidinol dehydrogenase [Myxococcales bacterium FL481]
MTRPSGSVGFEPLSPSALVAPRQIEIDAETWSVSQRIVTEVRVEGESGLRRYAEQFDGLDPGAGLVIDAAALAAAYEGLSARDRGVLDRTAQRIETFARAQRDVVRDMEIPVPGGRAGHRVMPMQAAGCYAPGGRFPLPSSVLMTVIPAKAAGVETVWVASPRPSPVTLAAAYVAGADSLLAAGGAQAVAALAFGVDPCPPCDIIVGPGNRYVTAAKQIVSSSVAIDMLAGPSELVIVADRTADPEIVAADLLAQAEHDPDAWPVLITTDAALVQRVVPALERQLASLPTADIARAALKNGGYVVVPERAQALELCDRLAAEHVELLLEDANSAARSLRCYGGLFVGSGSAEVFGDYGVGPNHVLPTAGTGRYRGGLSVLSFLSTRTWLKMDRPAAIAEDAAHLARLEGLEAHARAADLRKGG